MSVVAITGINGMLGGLVGQSFKSFGLEVLPLSTRPQGPLVSKLSDGVPVDIGPTIHVDQMIHCGALSGNGHAANEYEYANIFCTDQLLRWCQRQGVEHFVFISTGGVYGAVSGWVDEEATVNPEGNYALSKVRAEDLVLSAHLPLVTIIRLYFPLGNLNMRHFFGTLSEKVRAGNITFNTPQGLPRISPIDLFDIPGILRIVLEKKLGGIFNLSANEDISIKEIVTELANSFGVKIKAEILDLKVNDHLGCSDKIIKATGFNNFQPIRQVLQKRAHMALNGF